MISTSLLFGVDIYQQATCVGELTILDGPVRGHWPCLKSVSLKSTLYSRLLPLSFTVKCL